MARQPRNLLLGDSFHITVRCNNREFRLTRFECREVFLYWGFWQMPDEIHDVAREFVLTNCLDPEFVKEQFFPDHQEEIAHLRGSDP
jgi:hypothetical protein